MNSKKPWTEQDESEMLRLTFAKTPMHIMKARLGRTGVAILARLQKIRREKDSWMVEGDWTGHMNLPPFDDAKMGRTNTLFLVPFPNAIQE